jgi:ComF family protein
MSTKSNLDGRQRRWHALLRDWSALPAKLLFPPRCLLCGGSGQAPAFDLCAQCEAQLPQNRAACLRCAQPLSLEAALCGACVRRAPRFDAAFCPFVYAYPLDHMVRALKYHGSVAYARVLGELLAARLRAQPRASLPEMLLPVPLAAGRFRERGYNQAIELGRYVERGLEVPMRADVLLRIRETREQAGLPRQERRKNIRGAFALAGLAAQLRPTRHVALIDDVITTASTVNELARLLKANGVKRVEVWAVARA